MKKKLNGKVSGLEKKRAITGVCFCLPFILGFLLFMLKPLIQSFYMAFCEVQIGSGKFELVRNGFYNLNRAFKVDPDFSRYLLEGFARMIIYSLAIMVFSFFVALVLNQEFHGRALVRAIFFLPVILSSGVILGLESNNSVIAMIQADISSSMEGISITDVLENILKTAGVGTRAFEQVFVLIDNIYDIALASGIQIIVMLSGLQTIPKSMYEAASIEGCTAWESLWKVTFPMVSSIFLVNWVYTIVDFSMRTDNDVMSKIDETMVQNLNYGVASAMAWSYFVLTIAFLALSSFIISRRVYYYE
ncbi:MAG: sugar ABC transporter permease [Lachnospiraceae bacterium]|jgi:ABC-type sugar transport system permease subunit|nr:sugar ABC transporter permease [Lachnospiraceae bacterium]